MKKIKKLMKQEFGMGTIEMILILVVLIGLVIIFKSQLNTIVQSIFAKITVQTGII